MSDWRNRKNYCILCDLDLSATGGWESHRDSGQHQNRLRTASEDELSRARNPYDARTRCDICKGWMRNNPTTKTPLKRGPIGHASICRPCYEEQEKQRQDAAGLRPAPRSLSVGSQGREI